MKSRRISLHAIPLVFTAGGITPSWPLVKKIFSLFHFSSPRGWSIFCPVNGYNHGAAFLFFKQQISLGNGGISAVSISGDLTYEWLLPQTTYWHSHTSSLMHLHLFFFFFFLAKCKSSTGFLWCRKWLTVNWIFDSSGPDGQQHLGLRHLLLIIKCFFNRIRWKCCDSFRKIHAWVTT